MKTERLFLSTAVLGDTKICAYFVFVLSTVTQTICSDTHSYTQSGPQRSFIINTYTVIYIRETGNPRLISSILPSCLDLQHRASQPLLHPLISHHFTQLSASTSLFLLISHNNPPKSLSGAASPNSQSRNTMAAQQEVQASKRRSVSLMNACTSVGDFLCR